MGSPKKRLQYSYDVRGNRSALVDHDGGRFTYSYDSVGRHFLAAQQQVRSMPRHEAQ
jgi:hypothetical protein